VGQFDFSVLDKIDILFFIITTIIGNYYILTFAFINQKNITVSIKEEVDDFEFKNYRTMFNSLQEGVFVVDKVKKEFTIYFAN